MKVSQTVMHYEKHECVTAWQWKPSPVLFSFSGQSLSFLGFFFSLIHIPEQSNHYRAVLSENHPHPSTLEGKVF